jgi:hypothetical protein
VGKGANKQLLNNAGTAQSQNQQLSGQASGINNYLTPTLEAEANNPEGYTPQQMAYMNTASQQSLGGGAAATTGEANLTAARTRNAGGFAGAVGTANRGAQKQLSQNAVGIQTQQAQLQQQQRQQALQSLQSLYGIDENTALAYLNNSNSALNDENAASGAASALKVSQIAGGMWSSGASSGSGSAG